MESLLLGFTTNGMTSIFPFLTFHSWAGVNYWEAMLFNEYIDSRDVSDVKVKVNSGSLQYHWTIATLWRQQRCSAVIGKLRAIVFFFYFSP